MDILKNVDIEKINQAIKKAVILKKEISGLKKDILQLSKDAIEFLENGNVTAAEEALFASERKINKIRTCLQKSEISLHFQSDLLYSVEKEYSEAMIVCFVMKNQEIPGYEELNVDPLVYIHSFVEAVSELGKINEKLENRAKITRNKLAMQEIFSSLETLKHYAGNITGDMDNQLDKLRHKIYTDKTDINLTTEDFTALAFQPIPPEKEVIIEPNPNTNREIMNGMAKVINSINSVSSDDDLRDFKKTWKKVSENLKTGLIETAETNSDFEINGTVLTAYKGTGAKAEIPDGVTIVLQNAFSSCKELNTVKIPASVKDVQPYAFSNCKNLSSFIVDAKNPYLSQSMGILYNKNKTALICYPSNDKTRNKKSLPETLTEIKEGAFNYCRNLEVLTLSEKITNIHKFAFTHCYNLKIEAPKGSKAYDYALENNLLKTKPEKTENSVLSFRETAENDINEDFGVYFREPKKKRTKKDSKTETVETSEISEVVAENAETSEISEVIAETEEITENSEVITETEETPENNEVVAETAETPENSEVIAETEEITENSEVVAETNEITENSEVVAETDEITENSEVVAETDEITENSEVVAETEEITENSEVIAETAETSENNEVIAETAETSENNEVITETSEVIAETEETSEISEVVAETEGITENSEVITETAEISEPVRNEPPKKVDGKSQYTIRSTTKTLRQGTFHGQSPKANVTIGESIIKIDANAFDELEFLKSINVKKSVLYCSLDGVLYSKDRTTLIRYPKNKSYLNYSIDEKTLFIAPHAFMGCKRLATVRMPDTDITAAPDAFDDDTEIKIKNAKSGTAIYKFAKEKNML